MSSDGLGPARLLDAAVAERVLVFGSPPPQGDDLDLLARPDEEAAIASALTGAGFVERSGQWAAFHDCAVDVVEVSPAADWRLPAREEEALFAEALPLLDLERLVRPAPHHLLLIFARDLLYDGSFDDPARERLAGALREDGAAWERAQLHASGWRVARALPALRAAYESGVALTAAARADALAEMLGRDDRPGRGARVRAWRSIARRRTRGAIIAVSGLDGSGKTTQVEALRRALVRLGFDVAVEWTRLEASTLRRGIFEFARLPVSAGYRLLRHARRLPAGSARSEEAVARRRLRERSWLLTQVWVALVSLLHLSAQRRAVAGHLRAGRVVLCDRYTLDALTDLRFHYGSMRRFRLQAWLIRLRSQRPLRAYFLDVGGDTALERTTEDWTREELDELAGLFREHYSRLGYQRLDGERPRAELCREIALDAWMSLRGA